jgi:peptidoglycan/LPS O-acetylase OafA/YrhL
MKTSGKEVSFEGIFRILLMIFIVGTNISPYLLTEVLEGHRVKNAFDLTSEIKQINFLDSNALYETFQSSERLLVNLYILGHSAVYVFFFISGFSVGRFFLSGKNAGDFLFWRWRKIYIPSVLLLAPFYLFWFFVERGRGNGEYLLQILTMGFDYGNGEISTPAWFLTPLFASYGMALLMTKIVNNSSLRRLLSLLALMVLASMSPIWVNSDYSNYYYPIPLISFFFAGQIIAELKNSPSVRTNMTFRLYMEYGTILIIISFTLMSYFSALDFLSREVLRLFFAYTLLFIYISFKDSIHSNLFFKLHFLNRLSRSTFVVFLIHYPIFIFCYHEKYFDGIFGVIAFIGFVTIIFILSLFLQEMLLQRLDAWLLKLDQKGYLA